MAINNITLGEDQPLSNDLKPIKVGGEASILEISSPLPDGSDSGKVKVKGDLESENLAVIGVGPNTINGALSIGGGTVSNYNETKDDAAIVLEENFNIYVSESGYLRNLISKENGFIARGQALSRFVDEIRLIPVSSVFVYI